MIVGEPAELLGREVAADHLDLDGREARLALRARRSSAAQRSNSLPSPFGLA